MLENVELRALSCDEILSRIGDLAELLHACVLGGASVNFILPFTLADAEAFWRTRVLPGVASGDVVLLGALVADHLAGTVCLDTAVPPNQRHRGDVKKLLVHPDWRRHGIARTLMARIEQLAVARALKLVTLDTRTGDNAERLYLSLGYTALGSIPAYSRAVESETLEAATFFYKRLEC